MDDQLDDVKQMNKMVFYAQVVTVRDKQLEEAKILEQEYLAEQKKLDMMMEIERLKWLQAEEQKDIERKEKARRGAEEIIDQIHHRNHRRMIEDEIRNREK